MIRLTSKPCKKTALNAPAPESQQVASSLVYLRPANCCWRSSCLMRDYDCCRCCCCGWSSCGRYAGRPNCWNRRHRWSPGRARPRRKRRHSMGPCWPRLDSAWSRHYLIHLDCHLPGQMNCDVSAAFCRWFRWSLVMIACNDRLWWSLGWVGWVRDDQIKRVAKTLLDFFCSNWGRGRPNKLKKRWWVHSSVPETWRWGRSVCEMAIEGAQCSIEESFGFSIFFELPIFSFNFNGIRVNCFGFWFYCTLELITSFFGNTRPCLRSGKLRAFEHEAVRFAYEERPLSLALFTLDCTWAEFCFC